jgi:DNA repair ATPase RecN
MLKKLIVKNFRTHEDLIMELHPGVNVIWGLPGSGKTNILRTIDWMRTNKPKYDSVNSHFAKGAETKVEMEFDDGVVSLSKNPKSEEFVLNRRKSFSVTNRSIPEPIAQLINLSDVNIVNQLDPQFLITSTPGDVGQTINRITKIEKIDGWVNKLTTLINNSKWKIESLQAECETIDKELRVYDGIEDIEADITKYEDICQRFDDYSYSLSHLNELCEKTMALQRRITKLQTLDEGLIHSFNQMEELITGIALRESDLTSLTKIRTRYLAVLQKKNQIDDVLTEEANLIEVEGLLKEIESRMIVVETMRDYEMWNKKSINLSARLESKRADYIEAVRELGICPLCQNKITEKHIKELENSL